MRKNLTTYLFICLWFSGLGQASKPVDAEAVFFLEHPENTSVELPKAFYVFAQDAYRDIQKTLDPNVSKDELYAVGIKYFSSAHALLKQKLDIFPKHLKPLTNHFDLCLLRHISSPMCIMVDKYEIYKNVYDRESFSLDNLRDINLGYILRHLRFMLDKAYLEQRASEKSFVFNEARADLVCAQACEVILEGKFNYAEVKNNPTEEAIQTLNIYCDEYLKASFSKTIAVFTIFFGVDPLMFLPPESQRAFFCMPEMDFLPTLDGTTPKQRFDYLKFYLLHAALIHGHCPVIDQTTLLEKVPQVDNNFRQKYIDALQGSGTVFQKSKISEAEPIDFKQKIKELEALCASLQATVNLQLESDRRKPSKKTVAHNESNYKAALEKKKKENNALKKEIEAAKKQIAAQKKAGTQQIESLQEQLNQSQNFSRQLQEGLASLQTEMEEDQIQARELKNELHELISLRKKNETDLKALRLAENKDLTQDQILATFESLSKEVTIMSFFELYEEFRGLVDQVDTLKEENEALRVQLAKAEQAIVYHSSHAQFAYSQLQKLTAAPQANETDKKENPAEGVSAE
ncbi:MAG: hypothetical protein KBB83_07795 [Alphaproteobacteria bacterium]|nr:hypothetical protein [Alphaproteobacteria bacterium]